MLTNPVFRIDLGDYAIEPTHGRAGYDGYELDRQLYSMLPQLPPGSNIRLIVHKYPADPQVARSLRQDFMVQIESSDPWILAAWVSALSQEEAAA